MGDQRLPGFLIGDGADLARDVVNLTAQVFEFAEDGAALLVVLEDGVECVGRLAFGGQAGADAVGFVADQVEREHE